MINLKNFLKNCDVNIYEEIKTIDTKGGKTTVNFDLIHELVPCKIEMKEYDQPVDIAGQLYRKLYLIHLWTDNNGVIISPKENQIVEDPVANKRYKIIEVRFGSLYKTKVYKSESKAIILNDVRFGSFMNPL